MKQRKRNSNSRFEFQAQWVNQNSGQECYQIVYLNCDLLQYLLFFSRRDAREVKKEIQNFES